MSKGKSASRSGSIVRCMGWYRYMGLTISQRECAEHIICQASSSHLFVGVSSVFAKCETAVSRLNPQTAFFRSCHGEFYPTARTPSQHLTLSCTSQTLVRHRMMSAESERGRSTVEFIELQPFTTIHARLSTQSFRCCHQLGSKICSPSGLA